MIRFEVQNSRTARTLHRTQNAAPTSHSAPTARTSSLRSRPAALPPARSRARAGAGRPPRAGRDRSPRRHRRPNRAGGRSLAHVGRVVERRHPALLIATSRTPRIADGTVDQPYPSAPSDPPVGIATNGMSRSPTARSIASTSSARSGSGSSRASLISHFDSAVTDCSALSLIALIPDSSMSAPCRTSSSTPRRRFHFSAAPRCPRRSSSAPRRWAIPPSRCSIATASTALPRFHQAAKAAGLRAIIGAELTITQSSHAIAQSPVAQSRPITRSQ